MAVHSIRELENPFERVPPQSLEAEQATLGSILANPDALLKVVELVKAKDFYRNAHKLIYEAIVELFDRSEPVDIVTVSELLKVVVASHLWPNPSFHWTAVGSVGWGADAGDISAASDFRPLSCNLDSSPLAIYICHPQSGHIATLIA